MLNFQTDEGPVSVLQKMCTEMNSSLGLQKKRSRLVSPIFKIFEKTDVLEYTSKTCRVQEVRFVG